ncbi:MAG: TRAP transporter small permease subunit [Acetobacteraceae bacterium]
MARTAALAGGVVLVGAAVLTTVSVLARWLDGRPIRGDFELVALGVAIALFSSFAFAASRGANLAVTSFTAWLPRPVVAAIDAAWALCWSAACLVLAERLLVTSLELHRTGTVTMALAMPTWWVAGIGAACFALASVAASVGLLARRDGGPSP